MAVEYYKNFWLAQDPGSAWELLSPSGQRQQGKDDYVRAMGYATPRSTPPLRIEDHKLQRDQWVFVIFAANNDERPYLVEVHRYDEGWRVYDSRIYGGGPVT